MKRLLPTPAILLAILLAGTPRGLYATTCELPTGLVEVPAIPQFAQPQLERGLCNRLVNTLLTSEWLLSSRVAPRERAEVIGNLARRLHSFGFREPAGYLFQAARELDPEDFRFPFMIGLIEDALGRPGLAPAEAAAALEPAHPPLLAFLARLRLQAAELSRAVDAAEKALELDPDLSHARWTLAEAAALREDPAEVLLQVDLALALEPEANLLHRLRAEALTKLSRLDEAAVASQSAGSRAPTLSGPWIKSIHGIEFTPLPDSRLGQLALRRGQYDVASDAFDRALAADPSDVDALFGMGRVKRLTDQPDSAVRYLRLAVASDNRFETWLELGRALQVAGDSAGAAEAYRNALEHRGENKMARFWLAECLEDGGELEDALAILESLLEEGFGPPGYLQAADIAGRLGSDGHARRLLEEGLRRFPQDAELARALAELPPPPESGTPRQVGNP